MTSRRDFLATTSLAWAGGMLAARGIGAQVLPQTVGASPLPAAAWLPEPIAPVDLKALATSAIEAAKAAGASYADIRVGERHELFTGVWGPETVQASIGIGSTFTYGVRVIADGTCAFIHGTSPSTDAITNSARDAVAQARGNAKVTQERVQVVPAPVVTGEWTTPIKEDPFQVPLQDHGAIFSAWSNAIDRVRYIDVSSKNVRLTWTREHRVFASSEGALVRQTLYSADPTVRPENEQMAGKIRLRFPGLRPIAGGFEAVTRPELQDEVKQWAEYLARLAQFPSGTIDVGRYPVVFDGASLGIVLGQTLGPALELDRVLGHEADASGTSFLAPVADVIGKPVTSPLLSVMGTRSPPSVGAVKWDDDGVAPRDYQLISAGSLVDYHTSRFTVPALAEWYTRQGKPLESHGCAVAPDAGDPVLVRAPHLTVAPSTKIASVEDLCKDITRGLLVVGATGVTADQQLASATLRGQNRSTNGGPTLMFEIAKGRIVRRLFDNGIQVATAPLWKTQLVALGDASTVQHNAFDTFKGMPWQGVTQSVTAPAGLFKDVNVISQQMKL